MNFFKAKQYFVDEYFNDTTRSLSNQADVEWAIEKAYADMTLRTVSGAGKVPNLKVDCCKKVKELIDRFFQEEVSKRGRLCWNVNSSFGRRKKDRSC